MYKDTAEPKAIHQITPEEIVKLRGGDEKINIRTARRRIKDVVKAYGLNRNFITIEEYSRFYNFPVNDILKSIR